MSKASTGQRAAICGADGSFYAAMANNGFILSLLSGREPAYLQVLGWPTDDTLAEK